MLIFFTLLGITLLITKGKPTAFLRKDNIMWGLFSCSMCVGCWVGIIYGMGAPAQQIVERSLTFGPICATMGLFADKILGLIDNLNIYLMSKSTIEDL